MSEEPSYFNGEKPTTIDGIVNIIQLKLNVIKVSNITESNKVKYYVGLFDVDNTNNKQVFYDAQSHENGLLIIDKLCNSKTPTINDGKSESETSRFVSFYSKPY